MALSLANVHMQIFSYRHLLKWMFTRLTSILLKNMSQNEYLQVFARAVLKKVPAALWFSKQKFKNKRQQGQVDRR